MKKYEELVPMTKIYRKTALPEAEQNSLRLSINLPVRLASLTPYNRKKSCVRSELPPKSAKHFNTNLRLNVQTHHYESLHIYIIR